MEVMEAILAILSKAWTEYKAELKQAWTELR